MNWLKNFLNKKFKLKRVPPFLWPLLAPILICYFIFWYLKLILTKLFLFIMWILGFKKCHYCKKWRWAHNEMIVKYEYDRYPDGRIKVDRNSDYVINKYLKCVGCHVADKLTED